MSVDVHNHVMPREALDLLSSDPDYGVTIEDGTWSGAHHVAFSIHPSFYDPAAKLAYMESHRVDAAIVSPPPPLYFYDASVEDGVRLCEASNEGMAKFCGHAPDRLRWLANLPMQDPDQAAGMYRSAVGSGAVGAAIGTSIVGGRLDEEQFEPFWAAADDLGLPVLVHPAFNEPHAGLTPFYLQNVIGNLLETTVMVERLICTGVLARHPRVKLVLVHGGGYLPYQAGRLAHACGVRPEITVDAGSVWSAFDQLYFDTITHDPGALRYLVERVGADRVVLGTDMPFDMSEDLPMEFLEAALEPETIRAVVGANAVAIFGTSSPRPLAAG